MKPKYLFYIVLIVIMHYEVGRLVANEEPRDIDESESSYEKGVRLDDTSNADDIEFNYQGKDIKYTSVSKLRVTNLHRSHVRHFKVW
jgi:hypothetical protein